MREILGKMVLDSLGELVDPEHTAVIVVDMQNDFGSPGGKRDLEGTDISMIQGVVPPLKKLLDGARRAGIMVVHLQNTKLPGGKSDSPALLRSSTKIHKDPAYTVEGTWGQQFVEGLEPLLGETVVRKHRASGFVNTNLDLILRSNGIQSVVITGAATHGCVLATAQHAAFNDYYTIVVRDCVASYTREMHEAALKVLGPTETPTSEEILAEWAAVSAEAAG